MIDKNKMYLKGTTSGDTFRPFLFHVVIMFVLPLLIFFFSRDMLEAYGHSKKYQNIYAGFLSVVGVILVMISYVFTVLADKDNWTPLPQELNKNVKTPVNSKVTNAQTKNAKTQNTDKKNVTSEKDKNQEAGKKQNKKASEDMSKQESNQKGQNNKNANNKEGNKTKDNGILSDKNAESIAKELIKQGGGSTTKDINTTKKKQNKKNK